MSQEPGVLRSASPSPVCEPVPPESILHQRNHRLKLLYPAPLCPSSRVAQPDRYSRPLRPRSNVRTPPSPARPPVVGCAVCFRLVCVFCESISLSPVPWPLWPFFWRRSQREPSSDGSRQYHAFCSVDFLLLFGRVPSVLVPALSLPPAKSGHVACSPPFSLPTLRR